MSEFIFMLTHNDRTVDNALEVLEQVKDTGLRHIGFKDVGATPEKARELTGRRARRRPRGLPGGRLGGQGR